ncbi:hypothetical protein LCGC14_0728310 [marine sediment metagenome]|uniref:Uncharacterized protein n=1 Tax=marine sediment metagenome TaxID=412755 RepID=A0A0F9SVN0_9ZZZZ
MTEDDKVAVAPSDIAALQAIDEVDETIPIQKLIDLRLKNLPYSKIAAIVGCSFQNVHQRLQRIVGYVDHLQAVKDTRADLLTITNGRMLSELSMRDYKGTSDRDLAVSFGVLLDKERLERDKSTSNVNVYVQLGESEAEMQAKIDANKLLLGEGPEEDAEGAGPWTAGKEEGKSVESKE